MIYGINFNGKAIPKDTPFNTLPKTIRRLECSHDHPGNFPAKGSRVGQAVSCETCHGYMKKFVSFGLRGACDTKREADIMAITADNGHRRVHVIEHHGIFGIYTY